MGILVFYFSAGGWPGVCVLKLKLMLTQPSTELELELGLSLAKIRMHLEKVLSFLFIIQQVIRNENCIFMICWVERRCCLKGYVVSVRCCLV